MLDEYTAPNLETFIVRFWQERGSHAWRGKVIHVASRETCDFAKLEQAESFIQRFVAVPQVTRMPDALDSDIPQAIE